MANGTRPVGQGLSVAQSEVIYDYRLRELWVNGALVKRLDVRATNQIAILAAFQEEHWPARIDDPLHPKDGSDGKLRLRAAIHSLNGCQHPPLIRFFADGSGHGIRWQLVEQRGSPRRAETIGQVRVD